MKLTYWNKKLMDIQMKHETNKYIIFQQFSVTVFLMIKADQESKRNFFERLNALHEGCELTLCAFKSGIFPLK